MKRHAAFLLAAVVAAAAAPVAGQGAQAKLAKERIILPGGQEPEERARAEVSLSPRARTGRNPPRRKIIYFFLARAG